MIARLDVHPIYGASPEDYLPQMAGGPKTCPFMRMNRWCIAGCDPTRQPIVTLRTEPQFDPTVVSDANPIPSGVWD